MSVNKKVADKNPALTSNLIEKNGAYLTKYYNIIDFLVIILFTNLSFRNDRCIIFLYLLLGFRTAPNGKDINGRAGKAYTTLPIAKSVSNAFDIESVANSAKGRF